MLIECLIKRDGPTHVTVAGFDYVFLPDENGRKICKVISTGHQAHFLSMKDYVEYKETLPAKTVANENLTEETEPTEPELLFRASGEPYATVGSAASAATRNHKLEPNKFDVIEVDGGFAIQRQG